MHEMINISKMFPNWQLNKLVQWMKGMIKYDISTFQNCFIKAGSVYMSYTAIPNDGESINMSGYLCGQ